MWLVPKTALTTTKAAQSVRGQWTNRKRKVSHDQYVLKRMIGSTLLLNRCPISCVVYLTTWWLREAEVKIWSEILLFEACGFMPVFIIHMIQCIK